MPRSPTIVLSLLVLGLVAGPGRAGDGPAFARGAETALKVSEALADGSMPPKGMPTPTDAEQDRAAEALKDVRDPGPSLIQRLTRRRDNNTIRDHLGVDTRLADGGGGGGFDNNASTLFVPPILMERHLVAACQVLDAADPARWRVASPRGVLSKEDAARRGFEDFASRAFRRPVTVEEVGRLMSLDLRAEGRGDPFDAAVKLGLRAILVSPSFLFLVERERPTAEPYRIGDDELASHLSSFLWSSMPDRELLELAAGGRLHEPVVLDHQVVRMLADPRSRALAIDFAARWLRVDTLAHVAEPDRDRFPSYTPELRDDMAEEAVAFFHGLLRDDAPVIDLTGGDYTDLNEVMAGRDGVVGVTDANSREVHLKDPNRSGVLGMATILLIEARPRRGFRPRVRRQHRPARRARRRPPQGRGAGQTTIAEFVNRRAALWDTSSGGAIATGPIGAAGRSSQNIYPRLPSLPAGKRFASPGIAMWRRIDMKKGCDPIRLR